MSKVTQKLRLAILAASTVGWALGAPLTGHGETGGVPDAEVMFSGVLNRLRGR